MTLPLIHATRNGSDADAQLIREAIASRAPPTASPKSSPRCATPAPWPTPANAPAWSCAGHWQPPTPCHRPPTARVCAPWPDSRPLASPDTTVDMVLRDGPTDPGRRRFRSSTAPLQLVSRSAPYVRPRTVERTRTTSLLARRSPMAHLVRNERLWLLEPLESTSCQGPSPGPSQFPSQFPTSSQ